MTSAEFSPAPFAVPNAVVPGTTLPDLEYTLYQPQQLKSRVPALMIHGFATRGEQLYGGTSWIRQYLRAGYPVHNSVRFGAPCRCGRSAADPHAPVHQPARSAAAHRRH